MTASLALAHRLDAPVDLADLFPAGVAVAWRWPQDGHPVVPPVEASYVRRAVEKRRREFTAGRAAARAALAAFGLQDVILPPDPDRVPVWPPGFVGSITHCSTLAAAAVALRSRFRGIGLDIEERQVLDPGVAECLLGPGESAEAQTVLSSEVWPLAVFCAKEAAYKCVYPSTRISLDFQDLRVFDVHADGSFAVRAARPGSAQRVPWHALRGRLTISHTCIAAGMVWTVGPGNPAGSASA